MPTQNPRISITLTPALAAVLRQMSELTGNSQSAIVGELLNEAQPIFERMVRVLQAAKDVKAKVRDDMLASMEQIQTRLEQQLGLGLEAIDTTAAPLLERAEEIRRRRGRAGMARSGAAPGPAAAVSTPMSNRGVTPHVRGQKGRGGNGQKGGRRARD